MNIRLTYTLIFSILFIVTSCNFSKTNEKEQLSLPTGALIIKNVNIIDYTSKDVQEERDIIMDSGKIFKVVPNGKYSYPKQNSVVDASGKYVIPGLWDMHVNALVPGLMEWQHSEMLKYGITGFRDCGGDPKVALELKEKQKSGFLMPNFIYSGPILDGPRSLNPTLALTMNSPMEVKPKLDYIDQAGVDFYVTGSMLTKETFDEIIEEAKKRGKKVTIQGPFNYDYPYAAANGIGSIETLSNWLIEASNKTAALQKEQFDLNFNRKDTLSNANPIALFAIRDKKERLLYPSNPASNLQFYDNQVAKKLAKELSETEVFICPQLLLIEDISMIDGLQKEPEFKTVPPPIQEMWVGPGLFGETKFEEYDEERKQTGKEYFEKALNYVSELHKAGVPLLAGTHTILPFVYPGSDMHKELLLLTKAGLSNHEALMTATYNPAKYLGQLDTYGSIKEGKIADFILLDANPLEDIKNTRKIETVYKSGKEIVLKER